MSRTPSVRRADAATRSLEMTQIYTRPTQADREQALDSLLTDR
jgi:hypothetical protein